VPEEDRLVPGNFRKAVASATGYSEKTVHSVVSPYRAALEAGNSIGEALDSIGVAAPRGNFQSKTKRIKPTKRLAREIRTFVRERRAHDEQVNATQITSFLIEKGHLSDVKKQADGSWDPHSIQSARRRVRYLLGRLGYRRGRRKDGQVEEKPHHIEMWKEYLTTVEENRKKPLETRNCEVYLDESYCHNHHHNSKLSVHDPNDKEDKQKQEKHKGRRFCFAAAIRGPDPAERTSKAAYLPGTFWMFEPRNVKANTDYHKVFNADNFGKWWSSQLLPNIPKRSLVIMDGTSYHVARDPNVPDVSKMRKDELTQRLKDECGLSFPPKTYVRDLKKTLVGLHGAKPTYVERLTAEYNATHGADISIVLTPPYLSDLQPIERLWAFVKNWVAAQYDDKTTLRVVEERLRARFQLVADDTGQHRKDGKTYVQAFIDTSNKYFAKEMAELRKREGGPQAAAAEVFVGVEDDDGDGDNEEVSEGEWDSDASESEPSDEEDSETDNDSFEESSSGSDGEEGEEAEDA